MRIFLAVFIWISCSGSVDLFFSPDDKPASRLVEEINKTKKEVRAAVYYLSDGSVAQALIDAHKRGVRVEIISDGATPFGSTSKIKKLMEEQVPVFVPLACLSTIGRSKRRPLMHNKFALVNGKVWTGSFNWTYSANLFNYEDALLISNKKIYSSYSKRFKQMKRASKRFSSLKKLEQALNNTV